MKKSFPGIIFLVLLLTAACNRSQDPVIPQIITPPLVTVPDSSYRIEKIILSPGRIITFRYDSTGKISQSVVSDSLKNTFGIFAQNWNFKYDSAGRLKSLLAENDNTITIKTDSLGYVSQARRLIYGNFVFQTTLKYDSAHRITEYKYFTAGGGHTYSFGYHANGNLKYVNRFGSPSAFNFSVQPTTYDDQKSLWSTTDKQNHYIYWWLVCLTYFAEQSPALFVSYNHNVTQALYFQGVQNDTLAVKYSYQKSLPTSVESIRKDKTIFRGPYQIVYQAYPLP